MSEPEEKLLANRKLILAVAINLFSAIATPKFIHAREGAEAYTCINFMVQINSAKCQGALEHHAKPGTL